MVGLTGTDLEYGYRFSPVWVMLLLLLLFSIPVTIYLTVRFPSWTALRSPFRKVIAAMHLRDHLHLLEHSKRHA